MESTMEKEKIWYELPKIYQKQCQCCSFYYFVTHNFKHHKYFCKGCFFIQYTKKKTVIIKTTKENFRTVSSCFYKQVEESLEKN